jgi:hypothetical protein
MGALGSVAHLSSSCRRRGSAPPGTAAGDLLRISAGISLLMRRTHRFGSTASGRPADDDGDPPEDPGIGDLHREALVGAGLRHPSGHLVGAGRGHRLVPTQSWRARPRAAGTPHQPRRSATTAGRHASRSAAARSCPGVLDNPEGAPQAVQRDRAAATMEPIEPGREMRLRQGYGHL